MPLYEGGAGGGRVEPDGGDGGSGGPGGHGGSGGGDDTDAGDGGFDDADPDADTDLDGGDDGGGVTDDGAGGRGGAGGGEEDGGVGDGGEDDGGVVVGTLGLLDLCEADAECKDASLCRPMYVGGPKRCTRTCTGSAECMMGTRCESIGEERYCAQSDVGRTCWSDDECNAACLANQNYCSSQCSSGADCPNGFGCSRVNGTKMCVKVAIYCDQDDPGAGVCAPQAAACDVGYNLIAQSCTTRCDNDADCPQRASGLAPWRCNHSDGYCDRPNDIFGPIPGGQRTEYACQTTSGPVRNLCNDGLQTDIDAWASVGRPGVNCYSNFTTPGYINDSCIDSCRYRGGCAFGFHCAALSSLGAGQPRIGVCLPTGHGEIGDACTKHRDCAFGYCDLVMNRCSRDCSSDGVCPSGATCITTGEFVEGIPFKRCE